jgi:hypothetical protein
MGSRDDTQADMEKFMYYSLFDVIVDFLTFQADDITKVGPTKVHLVSYICVI